MCSEGLPGSFLVPTVDGTDCEGVVCPQDQSRTGVDLTGTHLLTRTGGGVRGDYHTMKEGDHWRETTGPSGRSRREQGVEEVERGAKEHILISILHILTVQYLGVLEQ